MALKIQIGQRFEKLVVVGRLPSDSKGYRVMRCQCDCGVTKDIRVKDLVRVKSCGCIRSGVRSIRVGDKFGMLTVLEYSHRGGSLGVPYFKFQCECGTEKVMNGYRIANGNAVSCGCYRRKRVVEIGWKRKLPQKEAAVRALFCRYRCRSKDRHIEFSVSQDAFRELVIKPCTYCGKFRPLNLRSHLKNIAYLSGLDRINSASGYVPGNVVPACCACNVAKASMSADEFRQWVDDVYNHISRA